jgi:rhodanese-related sulfurtransferase
VLFLGLEGDQARIVDPPNAVQLLPLAELLALWDGTGLVISREPTATWSLRAGAWLEQGIFLGFTAAVLAAARFGGRRLGVGRRRLVPAVLLILLGIGLAAAGHVIHDEGFLHNRAAVATVIGRHFSPELPSLSVAEVETLLGQPHVTFLDARFPRDYESGHLPGAINLPVYAGLVERAHVLATVPLTDRVVVYCQSTHCPWGEVIAADLSFRGYPNVTVFAGGWNEWQRHEQSKSHP